ncbi:MAG: phosphatase PAP2 family protein [Chthoniobacterales bacterium]|nr:phosphatase PAP2 family protein [Chthoniobacterales bacterium]
MNKFSLAIAFSTAVITVSARPTDAGFRGAFGERFRARSLAATAPAGPKLGTDAIHRWNQIAIDATGLDHTPVAPGENRVFGEQLGPGRAARAMAIVHIAIFDAVNAVTHRYQSYTGIQATRGPVSLDAAISQAAHDTLRALYPSQTASFDGWLAADLLRIQNKSARKNGIDLGQRVATALLVLRAADGSEIGEPHVEIDYLTTNLAGHWRQDPISLIPLALGAHWGACRPFVLTTSKQFRTPPPPALTSAEYATAYNETRNFGGDGLITPTQRTPEQTFIGIFWAYDGTPSLCAPPRLYNQIVVQIADQTHLGATELARLLALVNVAMADTGIAVWDSKYYWDFWRPITGIRESDPGTGPSGTGDGNALTMGDPTFLPLGAPASNLHGPNFTPPFPAYPSGHAGFGGAIFEILRRFYGTDRIGFTFVSDEFNGFTRGNDGNIRPYMPRSFSTLSQAEEENGQSRIYLGIHWSFDKTEGIAQGRRVADYVFSHAFAPLHRTGR